MKAIQNRYNHLFHIRPPGTDQCRLTTLIASVDHAQQAATFTQTLDPTAWP